MSHQVAKWPTGAEITHFYVLLRQRHQHTFTYMGGDVGCWIIQTGTESRNERSAASRAAQWVDGSAVTFTSWLPGEPNNANGNEDCVAMAGAHWNDVPCSDDIFAFICEGVPQ